MENFPSITDWILATLFGVALPMVSGLQSRTIFRNNKLSFTGPMKIRFYLNNSLVLFLAATLVALNWLFNRRDISLLGLRSIGPSTSHHLILFISLFFFLYVLDLWSTFGNKEERPRQVRETEANAPFLPKQKNELPAYFIMCCTAAFCEELIYRGYLIYFFQVLLRGLPGASTLSLLVPALLFSAAHYYQGIKAMFKIMVLATLLGLLFLNSGSLLIVCFLHFLVDWCSGLLYAYFAKKEAYRD